MKTCKYCGFSEILNGYNFCPKCGSAIWKDEFNLKDREKTRYVYNRSIVVGILFNYHYTFIDKKTGELGLTEYVADQIKDNKFMNEVYNTVCEAKRIIDDEGIKYTEKDLFRAFKYAFEFNGYEICDPSYLVKVFKEICKIQDSKLSTSVKTRALGAYKKYNIDADTAIEYAKKLVEINP